jgi:hypothetical protein
MDRWFRTVGYHLNEASTTNQNLYRRNQRTGTHAPPAFHRVCVGVKA